MVLSKIALAIVVIITGLFMVENTLIGYVSLISLIFISNYIYKLEDKANVDQKVRRISWGIYLVTITIGLLLINY